MDPADALDQIAFLMERSQDDVYRVRAYRKAAQALRQAGREAVERLAAQDRLTDLPQVGNKTAAIATEVLASGAAPRLLRELIASRAGPLADGGGEIVTALRGDCHLHSDWSDGWAPPDVMARAARNEVLGGRGHEWAVLTDHSPRLTVANGLSAERLGQQLDVVAQINEELSPFRLLTGIEVDILRDGTLDQDPQLLARLDVVVASVHSELRMDAAAMTARMVAAVSNPHVDVLGHCTGRMVTGRRNRPPSQFDAAEVFQACRTHDVAVEINARPERQDSPRDLLRQAVDIGCLFALDSDAHAPGQLDWQPFGAARAAECGVDPERVVTTWGLPKLLAWAGRA